MSIAIPLSRGGRPRGPRARGLSLIEALLSLAITAALLTAVGAAYQASARVIEQNDQFYRAVQAARVSLNQIMSEVRQCQSGGVPSSNVLQLVTSTGENRTYTFDSTAGTLTVTIGGAVPVTATMAHNVKDVQFNLDAPSGESVEISMKVSVEIGPNQILLSGSAAPRRCIVYQ